MATTKTEKPADEAALTLHDRILAARKDISPIEHDKWVGKYRDGQPDLTDRYGYWVTTHNAVNKAVLPAMNKHGLADWVSLQGSLGEQLTHDTGRVVGQNNIPMMQFRALFTYTISDGHEKICLTIPAFADDMGDKGPGKAVTYAFKTGRQKIFSLSTGDDDEGRLPSEDQKLPPEPALSDEQLDELLAFADETWGDDAEGVLKNFIEIAIGPQLGITAIKDIPAKHYDRALKMLHRKAVQDGKIEGEETDDV